MVGLSVRALSVAAAPSNQSVSPARYNEIVEMANGMSVLELGRMGDSIMLAEPVSGMEEASIWYMLALSRPRDNFSEKEWENIAIVYSNYGSYWLQHLNNSVTAFPLLQKALEIKKAHCRKDFNPYGAYILIAQIYSNYDNKEKALEYLKEGLKQTLASEDKEGDNYLFNNLLSVAW